MFNLFKAEEKKSFTYTSIEMRKPKRNYGIWVAGTLVLVVVAGFLYWYSVR